MKITRLLNLIALVAITGQVSCKKDVITQPAPPTTSFLSRTLIFPNQNGAVKLATYNKQETWCGIEDGRLIFSLFYDPVMNKSGGDGLVLKIDANHLINGIVKSYYFGQGANSILFSRYTYTSKENDGSTWASIVATDFGSQFEGNLTITNYDAVRKLLSGSYNISANKLINDPTKKGNSSIDPLDLCDLTISGSFSNLKIQ